MPKAGLKYEFYWLQYYLWQDRATQSIVPVPPLSPVSETRMKDLAMSSPLPSKGLNQWLEKGFQINSV